MATATATTRPTTTCGLVVSTLGIRTRGPGFNFRVVPLFHWVATLAKLFTDIASSQKGVFAATKWLW